MATPKTGDIVVIDFSVKTADGSVVGGTDQNGPQTVTMGKGEIMPQIEARSWELVAQNNQASNGQTDTRKTKAQLIQELESLREQVAAL